MNKSFVWNSDFVCPICGSELVAEVTKQLPVGLDGCYDWGEAQMDTAKLVCLSNPEHALPDYDYDGSNFWWITAGNDPDWGWDGEYD